MSDLTDQGKASMVEAALSGTLTVTVGQDINMTARAVVKMAEALDELNRGPLTEHAIVTLVHDATRVPKGHIKKLLACGPTLRKYFLKPEAKKA
jgi:hypothetical protein